MKGTVVNRKSTNAMSLPEISSFVVYRVGNNLFSRNYLFNIYTEFWIEMTYLLILSAIIYCS